MKGGGGVERSGLGCTGCEALARAESCRDPPCIPKKRRTLEQNENVQLNQALTSVFLFYEVGFVLRIFGTTCKNRPKTIIEVFLNRSFGPKR